MAYNVQMTGHIDCFLEGKLDGAFSRDEALLSRCRSAYVSKSTCVMDSETTRVSASNIRKGEMCHFSPGGYMCSPLQIDHSCKLIKGCEVNWGAARWRGG